MAPFSQELEPPRNPVRFSPGETWAYAIAEAAIEQLLQLKLDPTMWNSHRWRRSFNARVPEFVNKEAL
jgi:hypothetical protein